MNHKKQIQKVLKVDKLTIILYNLIVVKEIDVFQEEKRLKLRSNICHINVNLNPEPIDTGCQFKPGTN